MLVHWATAEKHLIVLASNSMNALIDRTKKQQHPTAALYNMRRISTLLNVASVLVASNTRLLYCISCRFYRPREELRLLEHAS